jgi:long-chain acyl-CoA synthetase
MKPFRRLCPTPYRGIDDYVAYHARQRPHKPAILNGNTVITYAALHRDLARMTQAVAKFGLKRGEIVAIGHADLFIHMLIVFAFENLGIVTGSFRPGEGAECHGLLNNAALILAQQLPDFPNPRTVRITDTWVASVLSAPLPENRLPAQAPSRPLVIYRSSGTTGQPKLMTLTTEMLELRLARQRLTAFGASLNRETRFLAAMHFSVGSIYMAAINCLRAGGSFIIDPQRSPAEACLLRAPTHLILLPYQLHQTLAGLPARAATGPACPKLKIQIIGGHVPEHLRRQVLQSFCGELHEVYGTNEVGAIGDIGANGVFVLRHGIEAEIVNEDGKPQPPGTPGRLRVRSQTMVNLYLDDPATTAEKFQDGWFFPGDTACLSACGTLHLLGRSGDVMNIGGIKIAATELESRLLTAAAGLHDIALVQQNIEASAPVTVCIIANENFQLPAFVQIATPILNCRFTVRHVAKIPRTAEGKIRRFALRDSVMHNVKTLAPATLSEG